MRFNYSRKRVLVAVVICVFVLYVGASAAVSVAKFVHERHASDLAEQLESEAKKDAKPSWTDNDAVSWLRQHGFEHILLWQVYSETGESTERYFSVTGYSKIAEKQWFLPAYWQEIEFVFDLDHHFKRLKSSTRDRDPIPKWR